MTRSLTILTFILSGIFLHPASAESQKTAELNENNIEQVLADRESPQASPTTAPSSNLVSAKESEIPVLLDVKKGEVDSGSPYSKMAFGVVIVGALAAAAWYATQRYRLRNRQAGPTVQMKILNQFHLGPKKSLVVVRVAGESMIIGVTDHHISLIKSLALLDEDMPAENINESFQTSLARMDRPRTTVADKEDDFAISGLKDFVSNRLKNMRSLD